jgi:glycosyltransferase involved in cell wall biosynthesis
MRIAQVAPLYERVPPEAYGGTERVVSFLTEELVRQGHDATLFASGDSITSARLVAGAPRALRGATSVVDPLVHHLVMLERVFEEAGSFDVVHFHTDYLHFPMARRAPVPRLTTLHGRLDLPDLPKLYAEYDDEPLVSISDAQRRPLPGARWVRTIHHGLPRDLFTAREAPGEYLAFVGRISPEKRVDRAIEIARRLGRPLQIAAKIDRVDREYFSREIEPLLSTPGVEFIGEIGDREKQDFLSRASALLFPIDWPEPFGLVMIEAFACGTPVVAYGHGSVPEIVDDGVTGFVVTDLEQAVEATSRVGTLSRRRCREVFETRFTVERMARDYAATYRDLIKDRSGRLRVA